MPEEASGMAAGNTSVIGTEDTALASSLTESNDAEAKLMRDAARTLPFEPVKDLLSNGVCARCIFRLFSVDEQLCSHPTLTTSFLSTTLFELVESKRDDAHGRSGETNEPSNLESIQDLKEDINCTMCHGVLQFMYNDKGKLVKMTCANDFIAAIGDIVKHEGHQIDSFFLEVSLPQSIIENEQAVRSYITEKYGSECWFLEKFSSESISTKDFLKLAVGNHLEKLMGVKSNISSSFRVRLTYTLPDASGKNPYVKENAGAYKRRKTDVTDGIKKQDGCHDLSTNSPVKGEGDVVGSLKFPLKKVNQCCSLKVQCCRTAIYIGGRYLKYSRNVSQSRWIIDDERMGDASIEELIGGNILPICQGDSYKFHAAGREDIDVRMLGTGRPFLVEIQNSRLVPSDTLVKNMEEKINCLESKYVQVKNLKVVGSEGWDLMREGEAEKQKQYAALVWIPRPLEDDDVQTLLSLNDMKILQKTPVRVLHRRSPLEREKVIHWMKIERIAGSSQYFLLHLCTQAGTYIKEFVHGDLGRTHPSVGSILKCRAEILRLDVTDVKMDWFQK